MITAISFVGGKFFAATTGIGRNREHEIRDDIACISLIVLIRAKNSTLTPRKNGRRECLTYTCLIVLFETKDIKKYEECINLQLILDRSLFT